MSHSKAVFVILTLCLLSRLIFFLAVKPWNQEVRDNVILKEDALHYHQLATSMILYHQFAEKKDGPSDTLRTPLYPLFISLIYSIQNQPRPWIVLLIQIVMDAASCVLLFFLITHVLNRMVAFYASLFYALDPFLILYSVTLLSEILFIFLCILGTCLMTIGVSREFERGSGKWIAGSAITFSFGTLVRPIAQFIPLVFSLFLLYFLRYRLKRALGLIFLFFLLFLLTLSPWMVRNLLRFNTLSLSTAGNYNLLILYTQPMEMERRGQPSDVVERSLLKEADQLMIRDGWDPQTMNDFQKGAYWKRLALHYITKYPFSFLKHYFFGIFHTMGNLATGPYADMLRLKKSPVKFQIKGYHNIGESIKAWVTQKTLGEIGIGMVIALYLLVSYFLLVVGLIVFWRKFRHQKFLWLSFLLVIYFFFITGTAGLARFKLPAIPFYLPFVSLGLHEFLNRHRDRIS